MLFDELVLAEQLFPHLYKVQETAKARVERIMVGLLANNPAPDKETDAMAWIRHMNTIKAMAGEVVVREVIYMHTLKWNQLGNGLASLSAKRQD